MAFATALLLTLARWLIAAGIAAVCGIYVLSILLKARAEIPRLIEQQRQELLRAPPIED